MATIRRRANGSWNAQIRVRGHKPESITAPTKTEVRQLAAERERELRAGEASGQDARATFGQLLDLYLTTNEHNRRKTSRQIEAVLETWRERFGRVRIGQIKSASVADARDEMLRKGLSGDTVRKALNILSGFFKWCVLERGAIKVNPVSTIKKPAEGKSRTRYLTPAERDQLFAACKKQTRTPKLYPLAVLGCYSGMRRGELLALRWSDLDLENGLAYVREAKNGQPRPVPIGGLSLTVLREWAATDAKGRGNPRNRELVFGSKHFPQEAWDRARTQAGLTDEKSRSGYVVFHSATRHTCGSLIYQSGGGLGDVAEVLGHTNLKMARLYAHHSPESRLRIVDRMVQAFG